MPSHYDDEFENMDERDFTKKRFEDYLDVDPGTLLSQDFALQGMLVDPEQAPYGITQYELNIPRYGLSGRFSRTGEGRSIYENRPVGRQQEQILETRPDDYYYPEVPKETRDTLSADAGGDAFDAAFERTMGMNYGYDGHGFGAGNVDYAPGAQEFLEGDYMSGFGDYFGLKGLDLGLGALGAVAAGASPGAVVSAIPGAIGSMFANPMTMAAIAGYTANQSFDLAERGSELADFDRRSYGMSDAEYEAALAEYGQSRQSRTGLAQLGDYFGGLFGFGEDRGSANTAARQAAIDEVMNERELDDPNMQDIIDAQRQAESDQRTARQELGLRGGLAGPDVDRDTGVIGAGGRYDVDYGSGWGTNQPTLGEWGYARQRGGENTGNIPGYGYGGYTGWSMSEAERQALDLFRSPDLYGYGGSSGYDGPLGGDHHGGDSGDFGHGPGV
jgi:hypothetical protein